MVLEGLQNLKMITKEILRHFQYLLPKHDSTGQKKGNIFKCNVCMSTVILVIEFLKHLHRPLLQCVSR